MCPAAHRKLFTWLLWKPQTQCSSRQPRGWMNSWSHLIVLLLVTEWLELTECTDFMSVYVRLWFYTFETEKRSFCLFIHVYDAGFIRWRKGTKSPVQWCSCLFRTSQERARYLDISTLRKKVIIKCCLIVHMNHFRLFPQTCYTTVNPEWEEAFTFFIQDPRKQDIDIQVTASSEKHTLVSQW